eukprot:5085909-Amphidinium_carterae.1
MSLHRCGSFTFMVNQASIHECLCRQGAAEPNKTLFVENLPPEATDTMLAMLFRQYPGFQEVQLLKARHYWRTH